MAFKNKDLVCTQVIISHIHCRSNNIAIKYSWGSYLRLKYLLFMTSNGHLLSVSLLSSDHLDKLGFIGMPDLLQSTLFFYWYWQFCKWDWLVLADFGTFGEYWLLCSLLSWWVAVITVLDLDMMERQEEGGGSPTLRDNHCLLLPPTHPTPLYYCIWISAFENEPHLDTSNPQINSTL